MARRAPTDSRSRDAFVYSLSGDDGSKCVCVSWVQEGPSVERLQQVPRYYRFRHLWPIRTARIDAMDASKQFCRVGSGGVNWAFFKIANSVRLANSRMLTVTIDRRTDCTINKFSQMSIVAAFS